jgi:hypothetical protein
MLIATDGLRICWAMPQKTARREYGVGGHQRRTKSHGRRYRRLDFYATSGLAALSEYRRALFRTDYLADGGVLVKPRRINGFEGIARRSATRSAREQTHRSLCRRWRGRSAMRWRRPRRRSDRWSSRSKDSDCYCEAAPRAGKTRFA